MMAAVAAEAVLSAQRLWESNGGIRQKQSLRAMVRMISRPVVKIME